jgi:hypothetical protein
VPADTPTTVPEAEPMVATAVLLLLHLQPDVPLLNVVVAPRQRVVVPEMEVGEVFTTTVVVAEQPPGIW